MRSETGHPRAAAFPRTRTGDPAYLELMASLAGTLVPTVLFSILFALAAATAATVVADPVLRVFAAAGVLLSVVRVAVLLAYRPALRDPGLDEATAVRIERRFGTAYVGFAVALGLFGARTVMVGPVELHMLVGTLLTGYAAGVAAGVSLRPRIGVTSMLLAVAPTAAAAAASGEYYHLLLATMLIVLLAGGLGSMTARFRAEREKIALRRLNGGLARRDHLTGLANRLGLADHYERARLGGGLIAVHCLDLDRFKPVNDRFGHPVGDALLRAVAGRIGHGLREDDLAARTGGDEFVIVQGPLTHPDQAELLARRLARALGEPYHVEGHEILIGTSVGYALSDGGEPLEELIAQADNALYAMKRAGGGVAAHSDARVGKVVARH